MMFFSKDQVLDGILGKNDIDKMEGVRSDAAKNSWVVEDLPISLDEFKIHKISWYFKHF